MKIVVVLVILIAAGLAGLTWVHSQVYKSSTVTNKKLFVVNSGDSARVVAVNLRKEDLIDSEWAMLYYLWSQDLRGVVKTGKYTIPIGATVPDIATMITTGKSMRRDIKVTFPEGTTLAEMAEILRKKGFDGDGFLALTQKPSTEMIAQFAFLREVPTEGIGRSLEGYLFPDTYFLLPEVTALEIAQKMLENFDKKVTPILSTRNAIANKYDLHQLITIASIVEGEVHRDDERPIVAGIFFNRLEIGMALGSDATLDYIFGEAKVKHSLEETKIDSPYNTYQVAGLPPGPIGNPGLKAIAAVFAPAQTKYLFFLNNATTGKTVFGRTFDEHIANKNKNGL